MAAATAAQAAPDGAPAPVAADEDPAWTAPLALGVVGPTRAEVTPVTEDVAVAGGGRVFGTPLASSLGTREVCG